jgi:hypothetical protein
VSAELTTLAVSARGDGQPGVTLLKTLKVPLRDAMQILGEHS